MNNAVRANLKPETAQALKEHAEREQRSVAAVIRLAIEDYLRKQGKRRG